MAGLLRSVAAAILLLLMTSVGFAAGKVVIVLDASGSMWAQIDGRPKLEIARESLRNVLQSVPADAEIGFMAYGHRQKGSCDDIELIDVCTPSQTHFELAWAALEAGAHVLCEKPVAHDYRETIRAAAFAKRRGLKTKLGFTFRYSPAIQFAKSLIDDGFIGTIEREDLCDALYRISEKAGIEDQEWVDEFRDW